MDLGILPNFFITRYGVFIGATTMMVLFSLGLADQINAMRKEVIVLNATLEEKVLARTDELYATMEELTAAMEELEAMNDSLVDKQRELENANQKLTDLDRLKSDFFANVSHEIRTPLTLMLSPVESVLEGNFVGEIDRDFFSSIRKNGIILLKLINNLLDFSKIEAGRMPMKITRSDIVRFMKNYADTVRLAAEQKMITVGFNACADSIDLYFDLEKMDRIVMNLLSNALKFTDRGGRIDIRIDENNGRCLIIVEDSGIGIPSESLPAIFNRFVQVHSEKTRRYAGTGIGLALVRELVAMHGGTISVESRHIDRYSLNHGTVFTIEIPQGMSHFENIPNVEFAADDANSTASVAAKQTRFTGMREMYEFRDEPATTAGKPEHRKDRDTVLVVEDNTDMRNLLQNILRGDYNIYCAHNGIEGLVMAESLRPDLILADVMMPGMDGAEMTAQIRAREALRTIPIVMLTARSDSDHTVEGISQGADDYMGKPFNPRELQARIRAHIRTYQNQKLIAVRNYEIEKELELARQIQQRLLPAGGLDIPEFSVAARYLPMDKVGGDFYDYDDCGELAIFFIADVSGHGIPGAFLSMVAKMALKDSVPRYDDPAAVMRKLNHTLLDYTVKSSFVTAFFCAVNKKTGLMKFCSAGHYPQLVYRPTTGAIDELFVKNKPLGCFADIEFKSDSVSIEPGDRIILFTDGIIEAMNPKRELFGDGGLRDYIRHNSALSPDDFCEYLIRTLRGFTGKTAFDDDVTLLVIDSRPVVGV